MRILIIDQCSGDKTIPDWFDPYDAEVLGEYSYEELIDQNRVPIYPARELYQGRQQQYITRAVDQLRETDDTIDRLFISAGFGLVDEDRQLPPYNVTFKDLSDAELHDRAARLEIQEALIDKIESAQEYDLIFFALGFDYYKAIDLSAILDIVPESTFVVLFNQEKVAEKHENAISIAARTEQAEEQGTIVVALKGKYLQNFAEHRTHGATVDSIQDIVAYCISKYTTQTGLKDYDSS